MSTTASRTAQYIAQAGSPADLTAGVITLRTGTGPQEVVDASLNLYKIIDAFYQLTDKHPALKVLPLLGLGNALRKASLDISATGAVTRAYQLSFKLIEVFVIYTCLFTFPILSTFQSFHINTAHAGI